MQVMVLSCYISYVAQDMASAGDGPVLLYKLCGTENAKFEISVNWLYMDQKGW